MSKKQEIEGQAAGESGPQVWYHYIGGHYTPQSFIAEARVQEVSRRALIGVAKRMAWGDRVIILKCRDSSEPSALVLGEFVVKRITLMEEVAMEVGQGLIEAGRAYFQEGGGDLIQRACGSYVSCGTFFVDADISEVLDEAAKVAAAKGIDPWVLVGGPLIKVHHPPLVWAPSIPFHRTFTLAEPDQTFSIGYDPVGKAWIEDLEADPGAEILAVRGYQKRRRRRRQDTYRQEALF